MDKKIKFKLWIFSLNHRTQLQKYLHFIKRLKVKKTQINLQFIKSSVLRVVKGSAEFFFKGQRSSETRFWI